MPLQITITGVGLRSSVGQCAAQSAAAVRAGLSGSAEWPAFDVRFGPDAAGAMAAAVHPDLGDASWAEKAPSLALQPLLEALWNARCYDVARERVGLYLGVPPPERDTDGDEEAGWAAEGAAPAWLPVPVQHVAVRREGTPASFLALRDAAADLESRRVDVAVVGGIDSLVHSEEMGALLEDGRLKTPGSPTGLVPGEAAAFVVLERPASARARGAQVLARVAGLAVRGTPSEFDPARPSTGRETADVLHAALADSGLSPERIARVIVDLNGERWRFLDWAMADARALSVLAPGWRLWYPAECWGDVGAASGAAYLVLAARAFARGYAGGPGVLTAAISESGVRAAAVVTAP